MAALAGAGPASAGTFTVTGTGDLFGADGKCTLREALFSAANGALPDCPGTDDPVVTIVFNIPGAGVPTITTAGLTVAAPVLVDGYSQPGATSNNLASGSNARLTVELAGNVGIPSACLTLGSGAAGSSIRGLVIRGCVNGVKVDENSGQGIEITSVVTPISGITIGGLAPADRNVISGNGGAGIRLLPGGAGDLEVGGTSSSLCWTG